MNKCSCNHWLPNNKEIKILSQTARIFTTTTKLKILIILLAKEHCVCEIQNCLKKEQSLISHHLADLIKEKWIRQRRGEDARQVFYSLTKEGKRKLKIFLKILLRKEKK